MAKSPDWDAFICYASADEAAARAIQSALQQIARRRGQTWALRVFDYRDSSGATVRLWESLQDHIDRSRFLVVLLSAASCDNANVLRELKYWVKQHGVTNRLALVVLEAGMAGYGPEGPTLRRLP